MRYLSLSPVSALRGYLQCGYASERYVCRGQVKDSLPLVVVVVVVVVVVFLVVVVVVVVVVEEQTNAMR
ncbi:hypothetical protein SAMD00023353_1400360 [Rosellinia necatrix]|uniref:Uncharacterized protein n=1 Tax=Rosellinia necatrix TaxID=77044 RepID=A0A1S8A7W2_ROSNE|nr:hypothetical protein SAMD00023353_1400360 [Rosellinia necatrix]